MRRGGVTLLEVVLSMGLLSLLMGMMFGFYRTTLDERTTTLAASQKFQLARSLMTQMTSEIRQASSFTPFYGTGIVGGKDWIRVFTTRIPRKILSEDRSRFDRQIPGEFDLMEVRYYIARHPDIMDEEGYPIALGLVRKETRTLEKYRSVDSVHGRNRQGMDSEREAELQQDTRIEDDLAEEDLGQQTVKEELYAPEIKYLRFHYFDGSTWWPDWRLEGANSLPQVIRITIGFEPKPPADELTDEIDLFIESPDEQDPLPKDQYTTFVRLLESDTFFGSRITRTAQSLADQQEQAEGF